MAGQTQHSAHPAGSGWLGYTPPNLLWVHRYGHREGSELAAVFAVIGESVPGWWAGVDVCH